MASSLHLRFSSTPQQPLLPPPPSSSSSVISITSSRRRFSSSVKQESSRRSFPLISAFLFRIRRPIRKDCCSLVTVRAAEESSSGITDDDGKGVPEKSVSVVLLAGGKGKRMGAPIPKQYLPLLGKPIALYSLYTFADLFEVKEIIVVCDPSYRQLFGDAMDEISVDVKFALPGKERQDSVFNGIQEMDQSSQLVCIHDSARPLVTAVDVQKVIKDGWLIGAAVLGVPVKATIKEAHRSFVVKTLDRKTLWEMQTPQVIRPQLLNDGFELVRREGLVVTDDVSIVEFLKHPVYITEGSYTNIKVTTPDDLLLAERIINLQADKNTVKAART